MGTRSFVSATLGTRFLMTVPASIMTAQDLRRILAVLPPTPTGFRLGAYLTLAFHLGHRPSMLLACYPTDVTRIPNTNLYKISNLRDVKGTTTRILSYNLPEDVSYWIHRFVQSRPMREWTSPNTFFGFKNVESLDVEMNNFAVRAGYPSNYFFTSYSLRRGKVNQDVGDLILLHGYSRERAVRTVKSGMGWALAGDTIEMYITPLVNKCLEIVENGEAAEYPNGVDSMSLLEQHPDLAPIPNYLVGPMNDQLPGPWW